MNTSATIKQKQQQGQQEVEIMGTNTNLPIDQQQENGSPYWVDYTNQIEFPRLVLLQQTSPEMGTQGEELREDIKKRGAEQPFGGLFFTYINQEPTSLGKEIVINIISQVKTTYFESEGDKNRTFKGVAFRRINESTGEEYFINQDGEVCTGVIGSTNEVLVVRDGADWVEAFKMNAKSFRAFNTMMLILNYDFKKAKEREPEKYLKVCPRVRVSVEAKAGKGVTSYVMKFKLDGYGKIEDLHERAQYAVRILGYNL